VLETKNKTIAVFISYKFELLNFIIFAYSHNNNNNRMHISARACK